MQDADVVATGFDLLALLRETAWVAAAALVLKCSCFRLSLHRARLLLQVCACTCRSMFRGTPTLLVPQLKSQLQPVLVAWFFQQFAMKMSCSVQAVASASGYSPQVSDGGSLAAASCSEQSSLVAGIVAHSVSGGALAADFT